MCCGSSTKKNGLPLRSLAADGGGWLALVTPPRLAESTAPPLPGMASPSRPHRWASTLSPPPLSMSRAVEKTIKKRKKKETNKKKKVSQAHEAAIRPQRRRSFALPTPIGHSRTRRLTARAVAAAAPATARRVAHRAPACVWTPKRRPPAGKEKGAADSAVLAVRSSPCDTGSKPPLPSVTGGSSQRAARLRRLRSLSQSLPDSTRGHMSSA